MSVVAERYKCSCLEKELNSQLYQLQRSLLQAKKADKAPIKHQLDQLDRQILAAKSHQGVLLSSLTAQSPEAVLDPPIDDFDQSNSDTESGSPCASPTAPPRGSGPLTDGLWQGEHVRSNYSLRNKTCSSCCPPELPSKCVHWRPLLIGC